MRRDALVDDDDDVCLKDLAKGIYIDRYWYIDFNVMEAVSLLSSKRLKLFTQNQKLFFDASSTDKIMVHQAPNVIQDAFNRWMTLTIEKYLLTVSSESI